MSEVTVYSADPCSYCARAKGLLRSHGIEFTEINLSKDPVGRVELASRTGMMTFPQVLIDGQLVGGFTEVKAAAESGRLNELLAGSGTRPEGVSPGSAEQVSPGSVA
ncbi:MAG: glutaredoxin family protein [Solirubrobacteraceae bacterium]|jgi:glutaredoxin 3